MKHKIDPSVLASLWTRMKNEFEHQIGLFCRMGIKPRRGQPKHEAEFEVWALVAKTAFEEGVRIGYDMGCVVSGAPDPAPDVVGEDPRDVIRAGNIKAGG